MGIYPEGGTNKTDQPLLPFRNGAFKVAQRGGVPIVVTTIRGTKDIMKRMFRKTTHVYIDVLRVIPFEDIDHVHTNQIGELVYDIMLKDLRNL
jgi:1-acyl-sn-glycerol-3-phosphate acyltransferase